MSDIIWNHLRDLHNRADLTLAPSLFTKRQLEGAGFERVEVWSRGVDTQKFSPRYASAQMRDRLSAGEPAKPLLIFVGRLSPEKRIDLLRPVMDANPHVRLAIIGDGPQEKSLKRMFANTPTVFTGALRGHELSQAYASANIFAYTGAHETFGNVVLEAMASGLAVIAPQAGGLLDFAQHGDNALLYQPANSRQLSSFVSDVSGDPRLAGDLAYFALQTAQALTWQDTLDRLVMRYESLIHPQGHPVDLAVSKTSQIQIA